MSSKDKKRSGDYADQLRALYQSDPKKARDKAKKALIRTGVLDREGKEKEKIVTWD